MSFLSVVKADLSDITSWLETVGEGIESIIKAIVSAEQQELVTTIIPLFKQAAVNLQNESPGLDAKTFIPALVAAVLPILPVALADLEQTFIFTLCSQVATELSIPNTPGNQGVVS